MLLDRGLQINVQKKGEFSFLVDGVTMRLGWCIPLQDCIPLLPRCKTVSWGLKCQPLILNIGDVTTITCVISTSAHYIIGPPYITHTLYMHAVCKRFLCIGGWKFGNRL